MEQKNSPNGPPPLAIRFFKSFCNNRLSDAILGDLIEMYEHRRTRMSKRRADWLFIFNVIQFLQPFALNKRTPYTQINHNTMLKNYVKIAWRNMNRQKMYTAITIGGFALGLATCLLIFLFVRDEVSYDKHYAYGDRLFRVYNQYDGPVRGKWTSLPASFGSILKEEYPDVEKNARLIPQKWFNAGSNLLRRDEVLENTFEEGFAYADPELLEVLEIPMIYGDHVHALQNPNSIVISKRIAEKYFGNENPTGKILILNDVKDKPFTIGGVMDDFPKHTHLHFDFLITLVGMEFWPGEQTSWCCWNYDNYIRLRPNVDVKELETKMLAIRDKYQVGYAKETGDVNLADIQKNHSYKLQKVSNIHLNPEGVTGDETDHGDMAYLWLFGGIACFILALACINFINLSTARSANRAKEVGLRKVVGSARNLLIRQFLTESLLYSVISFVIALILVIIVTPYFNMLAGKSLAMPWVTWWFVPSIIVSAFVIGIIAGIYPSFYLSAFQPIEVLKGTVSKGSKSSGLRGAMVVFQFTTSIILIIGTIVISRQMDFILHTKVGFDKDQVLLVQGANTLDTQQQAFKDALLNLADVRDVTITNYLPVSGTVRDQNGFWKEGRSKIDKAVYGQNWGVDETYIKTMGMKLIEGRDFIPRMASDSQSMILNQSMVKALGLKKPLGEKIQTFRSYTVIGVVEDFNYETMKGEIKPLALHRESFGSIICVRSKSDKMQSTITSVTNIWNKFMPNQPFRYTFLDESYARMYNDVQRTATIFGTFAVLAIGVACLGLFALSAFLIEQRGKEISVRLVLGASVNNILQLLGTNFMKLIAISFIIAIPVGWYGMNLWLEDYEYKITVTWDVFAFAGLLAFGIAMITISYQSVKAALVKPAKRLRTE